MTLSELQALWRDCAVADVPDSPALEDRDIELPTHSDEVFDETL